MALHSKKDIEGAVADSLFATVEVATALPKYRFPEREILPDIAFQVIRDELLLDGNARQNLATFCQTWEEPQVHALMDLAMDKNLIDEDDDRVRPRPAHGLCDLFGIKRIRDHRHSAQLGEHRLL